MAATHGRLTGKSGVCPTTLGPGALYLTTGAAHALLGAMPMVMITGQKGILSRRQARFQVADVVSTMTLPDHITREFKPVFSATDLMNLPNHHIFLKLMIDGEPAKPFSAVTLPPSSMSWSQISQGVWEA